MVDGAMGGIHVVLCRAESSGNVGAVCRAMASMGAGSLTLADCGDFDEVQVRMYALGAYPIYLEAKRCATLREALEPLPYAAAFTRRVGKWRKESADVRDWAPGIARRLDAPLGLVFGNERDGLNDAELSCCDEAVHIGCSERFPSLNLSHAVQLALWEIRRSFPENAAAGNPAASSRTYAGRGETSAMARRVSDRMESVGFFKLGGRAENEVFLREVCARAALSTTELERFGRLFMKLAALDALDSNSGRNA